MLARPPLRARRLRRSPRASTLRRRLPVHWAAWSRECWCDNDYGSRGGGLENAACDADGDGAADCGQGVDGACGLMNAVYDTATSEYMGCYPDGTDPVGVTFEGDAYNTAEYGVHLDGRGDYITIDPLGQPNNYGTYRTDTYANDGTFSISFWFWKRKCTVPGGFEWLFSHQDNNQDIYTRPANAGGRRTPCNQQRGGTAAVDFRTRRLPTSCALNATPSPCGSRWT